MGVSSNQARLMTLTSRMADLELRAQQISNQKIIMSLKTEAIALKYSNDINDATNEKDGSVDEARMNKAQSDYETASADLSKDEKLLDLELSQVNTEHNAAKTEYDSVKSLVSDNVDRSFNLFG